MKAKFNSLLIGIFSSILPLGLVDCNSAVVYKKLNYTASILEIDLGNQGGGTWEALFANKEFIDVYEHNAYYIDSAIRFLSDPQFTIHQKTICVYTMQRTKLKDYIRILEHCANLFNKGKIEELLMNRAISPTFGRRKIILKNYDDEAVKSILERTRDGGKASQEFKVMIDKILSGEYWKNTQKFID
ncbi:MAG: hypothetical protein ABIQ31_10230 [Ferruginibacter sp.]